MSRVTAGIMRINQQLDEISGLDGIVADKIEELEKQVKEMVSDILNNHSEASLFNYYGNTKSDDESSELNLDNPIRHYIESSSGRKSLIISKLKMSEQKDQESDVSKLKDLKLQRSNLDKEIAITEYNLYEKGKFIKPAMYAGGSGHDGYYHSCPYCKETIGGYEGKNTSLKVDDNIYKCEKCGKFFKYQ